MTGYPPIELEILIAIPALIVIIIGFAERKIWVKGIIKSKHQIEDTFYFVILVKGELIIRKVEFKDYAAKGNGNEYAFELYSKKDKHNYNLIMNRRLK